MSFYGLARIDEWALHADGFRQVASCTSRQAGDAAARLLGIRPHWHMGVGERTERIRELDEAIRHAMAEWLNNPKRGE